jgi:hypothetical protein
MAHAVARVLPVHEGRPGGYLTASRHTGLVKVLRAGNEAVDGQKHPAAEQKMLESHVFSLRYDYRVDDLSVWVLVIFVDDLVLAVVPLFIDI